MSRFFILNLTRSTGECVSDMSKIPWKYFNLHVLVGNHYVLVKILRIFILTYTHTKLNNLTYLQVKSH